MSISEEEHLRRLRLYRQGKNDREIAVMLGMKSTSSISSWRLRSGLKPVCKRKRKDDKYHLLIRCNDPPSPEELAGYKRRLREHFDIV